MTDENKTAVFVSHILRALSEMIDKNPGMIKELGIDLSALSRETRIEATGDAVEVDTFSLFIEEGEVALRERLAALDLDTLKEILHRHNFDPSQFSKRWRDRDRVIDLIVKRVSSRTQRQNDTA